MAVAYDTASATQSFSNVSTVTTWSHTASGSNRYVRLSIAWAKLGTTTCSATYGGNAMTSVGIATASANWVANVTGKAQIFEYVAPATSAETVAPTFSASGNYGAAGTVSYTGVDQTTPSGAAFTGSVGNASGVTTSTRTVTDADTGDMVSDCIAVDTGGTSVTAGSTQRFNGVGTGYCGAGQDAAGSASVAMTWTWTNNKGYAHVAAAIYQASGGGATDLTVPDSSHAHTLDNVVLTSSTTLAVQDMAHAHALDAPTLSTGTALTVADAQHAHALDNVTLSTTGATSLTVADSLHGHALDAVGLTSQAYLAVADMLHAHALDGVTLTLGGINLVIAEVLHAHALDVVAMTLDTYLVVADLLHAHTVDNVLVSIPGGTLDLILKILVNRQELNPTTGTFTLYDDDGTTVLYTTNAWADAAGTTPYSGGALRRIDALF